MLSHTPQVPQRTRQEQAAHWFQLSHREGASPLTVATTPEGGGRSDSCSSFTSIYVFFIVCNLGPLHPRAAVLKTLTRRKKAHPCKAVFLLFFFASQLKPFLLKPHSASATHARTHSLTVRSLRTAGVCPKLPSQPVQQDLCCVVCDHRLLTLSSSHVS